MEEIIFGALVGLGAFAFASFALRRRFSLRDACLLVLGGLLLFGIALWSLVPEGVVNSVQGSYSERKLLFGGALAVAFGTMAAVFTYIEKRDARKKPF